MAKELPFQYWLKPIAKSISELNTKYAELTVKISQIESGSSDSSGSGSSGTGEAGVGIASLVQTTTSSVSDGANVWTATLTDGSKYTLTVRNGSQGEQGEPGSDGVGISSIQQTVVSSVSGGRNTITVTLTDGSTKNLYVYNGAQGEPGADAEGGSLPDASEYEDGYILMVQDGEWTLVPISEYVGESSGTSVETATGTTEGVVKLSNSVTSGYGVNSGYAATPSAVKEAYDYADEAYTRAQDAYNLANESGTNASTALSTANTASANASTALSTANTASSNASTALSTANTASANASTALSTANEAIEAVEALGGEVTTLEDYVVDNVDAVETTLGNVVTPNTCNIAFITDIHANCNDTSITYAQDAMTRSVQALNEIAKNYNICMLVLGGDYLGNQSTAEKENCLSVYTELADIFAESDVPVVAIKGNHDDNSIAGTEDEYISDAERYAVFDQKFVNKNGVTMLYGNVEKTCGYIDIPNYKIRVLFVNTSDPATYVDEGVVYNGAQNLTGLSDEQFEFLKDALYISEEDWGVVIFSHHNLFVTDYYDYPSGIQGQNGDGFRAVIEAFQNKTKNTTYGVDYSSNGSNEVICSVHGHLHSDRAYLQDSGLLVISVNPAAPENTNSDDEGNTTTKTYPGSNETAWDIISIDRGNKKVYTTRYGLGDNRELSYGTDSSDDSGSSGGGSGDIAEDDDATKIYTEMTRLFSGGDDYIDTEVTGFTHFALKIRKETAQSTTVYHMGAIEDANASSSDSYARCHVSVKDTSDTGTWNVNIGANGSSYGTWTGNAYGSEDDVLPIEGSVNGTTASFYVNYSDTFTCPACSVINTTFWLFGRHSGSSALEDTMNWVGSVYYFKAYDKNDELIADMIPVLDDAGLPAMYCKVRNEFYYPANGLIEALDYDYNEALDGPVS